MEPNNEMSTDELIKATDALIGETVAYLKANGVEMPLDKWVTIKRYCEMYDIKSTGVVSNWISRGIIPPENVQTIEELNGLKLIKAIAYK